ncbi:VRR-NUC domain-containing protein [Pectobacterium aroidearum]|uniref:VRR-NUC domain-containing protein n=1 Tax=Pectobacterium aroidearum TaxID=1201031 RepID=UPI003015F09B
MYLNVIDALSIINTKAKLETRNGKVTKVLHQAELEEQAALIEWANKTMINSIKIEDYLLHIPNEGKRGPKAACDAFVLVCQICFWHFLAVGDCGLWIEMKAKGGKLSAQQKVWLKRLEEVGYRAVCCFGCNWAIEEINDYLIYYHHV